MEKNEVVSSDFINYVSDSSEVKESPYNFLEKQDISMYYQELLRKILGPEFISLQELSLGAF